LGLKGIGYVVMDWIHIAQDRDQWILCEHGNEYLDFIKGGEFLDQLAICFLQKKH
jgi:hypothetical protein